MKHSDDTSVQRWTTQDRYYTLRVQQDLFGQWELLKVWGSLHSRLGRHQVVPTESKVQAERLLAREARRRQGRGYSQPSTRDPLDQHCHQTAQASARAT